MNNLEDRYNTAPDLLDGFEWSQLVVNNPQYAEKCNWGILDVTDWGYLLAHQPQFADKCNMWNQMNDSASLEWEIGFVTPQTYLLIHQPQFADKFSNWDELEPGDWDTLIAEQPQFAEKCNCWDRFYDAYTHYGSWGVILEKQPQFSKKYIEVMRAKQEFDINPWVELFCNDAYCALDCAEFCDEWQNFTDREWKILLEKHPEFADKCPFKEKLNK